MGKVFRKVAKFFRLAGKEKALFIEALFVHLWVGLLLKVVPFRWIPRLFSSPKSSVLSRQSAVIGLIKDAIWRAEKNSPWKNKCLVSSLAGRCMLRRRKIHSQLSLGMAKNTEGKTIAHAWLRVDEYEIVSQAGDYLELKCF